MIDEIIDEELNIMSGGDANQTVSDIGTATTQFLKENGGYHAAREEQGKNEARIRQLKQMLENAQIGTPPSEIGVITIGHVVTVEFSDGEKEKFWLVSREEAQHATIDVYSPDSPLGKAVLGKKQGDQSSFALPNGKEISITIKKVETYSN